MLHLHLACVFCLRSTRLSRASTGEEYNSSSDRSLRSTRLSRASTSKTRLKDVDGEPSIHKALASLDLLMPLRCHKFCSFDPQGSREPRREHVSRRRPFKWPFDPQGSREPRRLSSPVTLTPVNLRSTRLSRASTDHEPKLYHRQQPSIHKALASLDTAHAM